MAKNTAQSVCKNNWLFVYLYKSLTSTCFVLLNNFLFMCNAFVFCLKKQYLFFFGKSCADSFLCLYTYSALLSRIIFTK